MSSNTYPARSVNFFGPVIGTFEACSAGDSAGEMAELKYFGSSSEFSPSYTQLIRTTCPQTAYDGTRTSSSSSNVVQGFSSSASDFSSSSAVYSSGEVAEPRGPLLVLPSRRGTYWHCSTVFATSKGWLIKIDVYLRIAWSRRLRIASATDGLSR